MFLIAEKGGSVQVENEKNQIATDQEKFKEKIIERMKENLFLSMLSFVWNKAIDEIASMDNEKENLKKDFIDLWKKNIHEITQEQLEAINKILNDSNVDMINIITGKSSIADVEDYQSTINGAIKEIEKIFWKMSGK